MTSLDDAETDVIRELEDAGAWSAAERLHEIRKRRAEFDKIEPLETKEWVADFRRMRALSYFRYVRCARSAETEKTVIHARYAIGVPYILGIGDSFGEAVDDLIIKIAESGRRDFTVGSPTLKELLAARQERDEQVDERRRSRVDVEAADALRASQGPTFVDTATDLGFEEPAPDPRLSEPEGSMGVLESLRPGDTVDVEPVGRLEVIAVWQTNPELVPPASGGLLGVDNRSRVYRLTSSEWELGRGRYVNLQHEEAMRRIGRRDHEDDVPF